MRDDFAAFILTHGRPDNVKTLETIRKQNYTGKVYLIVDDQDKKLEEYKNNHGHSVIVFDKVKAASETDSGDNFGDLRSVLYARNACFGIAKELGLKYFVQLDDDYSSFQYRRDFNGDIIKGTTIKNLDAVFERFIEYLVKSGAKSIAMAQGGDFMGGRDNAKFKHGFKPMRKAMNSFFCRVDNPFNFVAKMNDDVTTFSILGQKGDIFLTIPNCALVQTPTQSNLGGLTDLYLKYGTYVKSFYTVMFCPSFTIIRMMGQSHRRLHHATSWINAVPMILDEKVRKTREISHVK